MAGKVAAWIVDRFALKPIYDHVLHRSVPQAKWYSGDGAALALMIGVQVVTGVLMAVTYAPTPDAAYESVVYITERQVLGWFLRGLHYWSSGMIMLVLAFHLFRQILFGGYKSPREATWLVGVVLLFTLLFMSYSGYLLRWDERAIHGLQVMLHMFSRVPLLGERLVLAVQGGPDLGAQSLTRLYAMHILIVPLLILMALAYHLYLVVVRGTITSTERDQPVQSTAEQVQIYEEEAHSREGGETFYPHTVAKSGLFAIVVLAIAVALTVLRGPQKLFPEANLLEPTMPSEEWWYWWYSGLIALLPPWIAPWFVVLFPVLAFVGLVLLPFLDRGPARGVQRRPFWAIVIALVVVALLLLSDYRRRSAFTGWPDPAPPVAPAGVVLKTEAERGRLLFAHYGCNSCHAVAGQGRQVGPDFTRLERRLSKDEIRNYVLQPPAGVAMPSYKGRLAGEDLEHVVEFCLVAQTFPREP